ncbi:hypothetical protein B0H15DRAFT_950801 [Mycena belliarum]|uniref:Uncharacterized protein n=1 Tax=Mycena belliarum TaxID=1033014 RepID=A0AAD6XPQ7_9AGAR|nr:hypothetical protein B0H15DRAFT_950801 [Mycena belliae]
MRSANTQAQLAQYARYGLLCARLRRAARRRRAYPFADDPAGLDAAATRAIRAERGTAALRSNARRYSRALLVSRRPRLSPTAARCLAALAAHAPPTSGFRIWLFAEERMLPSFETRFTTTALSLLAHSSARVGRRIYCPPPPLAVLVRPPPLDDTLVERRPESESESDAARAQTTSGCVHERERKRRRSSPQPLRSPSCSSTTSDLRCRSLRRPAGVVCERCSLYPSRAASPAAAPTALSAALPLFHQQRSSQPWPSRDARRAYITLVAPPPTLVRPGSAPTSLHDGALDEEGEPGPVRVVYDHHDADAPWDSLFRTPTSTSSPRWALSRCSSSCGVGRSSGTSTPPWTQPAQATRGVAAADFEEGRGNQYGCGAAPCYFAASNAVHRATSLYSASTHAASAPRPHPGFSVSHIQVESALSCDSSQDSSQGPEQVSRSLARAPASCCKRFARAIPTQTCHGADYVSRCRANTLYTAAATATRDPAAPKPAVNDLDPKLKPAPPTIRTPRELAVRCTTGVHHSSLTAATHALRSASCSSPTTSDLRRRSLRPAGRPRTPPQLREHLLSPSTSSAESDQPVRARCNTLRAIWSPCAVAAVPPQLPGKSSCDHSAPWALGLAQRRIRIDGAP